VQFNVPNIPLGVYQVRVAFFDKAVGNSSVFSNALDFTITGGYIISNSNPVSAPTTVQNPNIIDNSIGSPTNLLGSFFPISSTTDTEVSLSVPTVGITANPLSINAGDSSMISWNSINADKCAITGPDYSSSTFSGLFTKNTDASASTSILYFNISCSNKYGTSTDNTSLSITKL